MRLQVAVAEAEEESAPAIRTALTGWLDRAFDITIAPAGSAAAARNASLHFSTGPYLHFAGAEAPVTGSFLTLACRLMDREPDLAFVTGWGDAPLGFASSTRPCTAPMLLGRPAPLEAPAVLRRSACEQLGGFDESLRSSEDVDLCLRALAEGMRGAVIDAPWMPAYVWGGHADPGRSGLDILEKHRQWVEREAIEILLVKERWLRELAARAAERTGRRLSLLAELRRLDDEALALTMD